jgi:hypothetical protein
VQSTGPISRTSVGGNLPWTFTAKFERQLHCPACGQQLQPSAAHLAGNLLVCEPCVTTLPHHISQAIHIANSNKAAQLLEQRRGLIGYHPPLGVERTLLEAAIHIGAWEASDQPAYYSPYDPVCFQYVPPLIA